MKEAQEAIYEDIDNVSNISPIKNEEEKELTIKIAPGAFDSLIAHEQEKASDWEELYKSISKESAIKIGDPKLSLKEYSYRFFKDNK